jgi:hypothetical protein
MNTQRLYDDFDINDVGKLKSNGKHVLYGVTDPFVCW